MIAGVDGDHVQVYMSRVLVKDNHDADGLPVEDNLLTRMLCNVHAHLRDRVVAGWPADHDRRVEHGVMMECRNLDLDQRIRVCVGSSLKGDVHRASWECSLAEASWTQPAEGDSASSCPHASFPMMPEILLPAYGRATDVAVVNPRAFKNARADTSAC
jgi:hypothetical protein